MEETGQKQWPAHGLALESEFCDIVRSLGGDVESRELGGAYLAASPAAYHGGEQAWDLVPKMLDVETYKLLENAAQNIYDIMTAVTQRCIEDPVFCERFGLPASYGELMAIPQHYPQLIPLARVDLFLNEQTGDYWLCEVNTDGTFGYTVADEVTTAICRSRAYEQFANRHPHVRTFEHREAWIRALGDIYRAWEAPTDLHPDAPDLAVVDFPESAERSEFDDFIQRFLERGVSARFSDIRRLKVKVHGGILRLMDDVGPISCAWMRAVTGEILDKPCLGTEALMQAARQNLACIIGGFRTWPVATKTFFAVLHDSDAESFLSPTQQDFVKRHVPVTYRLQDGFDMRRFEDRARWIAKPAGCYNARDVVAGADVGSEGWESALRGLAGKGGVVQRYAPQFAIPVIPGNSLPAGADPLDFRPANTMMGLFLFNGRFSGVYSRCGYGRVIGEAQGRLNQGCLIVDE